MTTRKIVLTFGLIAGAILATMVALMVPLSGGGGGGGQGSVDFDQGEVIGYTTTVLAFIMVVLGIRTYRERVGGGTMTFGQGFKVGLLITLVASAAHVLTWEIVYFNFMPDFLDQYGAHELDKLRSNGATEAVIAAKSREMADFAKLYANPLFNSAITLLETLPVGLIITLVSSAVLRRGAARQS